MDEIEDPTLDVGALDVNPTPQAAAAWIKGHTTPAVIETMARRSPSLSEGQLRSVFVALAARNRAKLERRSSRAAEPVSA